MRSLVLTILVGLLVTAAAVADENPDLIIGLDTTDPPTHIDDAGYQVTPGMNETFTVYVVFRQFGAGGGMLGAAFKFDRTFSGFKLLQTNLLPGLDFGDVEVDGWAITAGAECQFPTGDILVAASAQYMYTGTPGTITIIPHPVDGNSAADCTNELDFWEVYGHLGVNTDAPLSPVEVQTWSGIKALYR